MTEIMLVLDRLRNKRIFIMHGRIASFVNNLNLQWRDKHTLLLLGRVSLSLLHTFQATLVQINVIKVGFGLDIIMHDFFLFNLWGWQCPPQSAHRSVRVNLLKWKVILLKLLPSLIRGIRSSGKLLHISNIAAITSGFGAVPFNRVKVACSNSFFIVVVLKSCVEISLDCLGRIALLWLGMVLNNLGVAVCHKVEKDYRNHELEYWHHKF